MVEIFHAVGDIMRGGNAKRFAAHHGQEISNNIIKDAFYAVGPGLITGGVVGVAIPGAFEESYHPLSLRHAVAFGILTLIAGIGINAEKSRRIGRDERLIREEEIQWQRENPPKEVLRREVLSTLARK